MGLDENMGDATLKIIGREKSLFQKDLLVHSEFLADTIRNARCLVIGGAGTIGQATCLEIFKRDPAVLHVVDISENNLVELVRDLRSSIGYGSGEFGTYALDCGSVEFESFMRQSGGYDYVFNLSALKHVRSESNPYTLMRMIRVNILNTISTLKAAHNSYCKKYFCVSTDKAANPVNMMGASKNIMEMFLARESKITPVSTARFANVAFSDGSLLHGFRQRLLKGQPLSAPTDVKRYFVSPEESGQLCLLSALLGDNRDIFFPKLDSVLHMESFDAIATNFLESLGYKARICESEDEARRLAKEPGRNNEWPCFFFSSDTTGEKMFEEFFTETEEKFLDRFCSIGVVKCSEAYESADLERFEVRINEYLEKGHWTKQQLVNEFRELLPQFLHNETGKYLDQRM